MLIKERYPYSELNRVTINGKRHYASEQGNPVPSVTTILSATADTSHLEAWRKRLGEAEAKKQTEQAAALGQLLHTQLEQFMLGNEMKFGGNLIHTIAARQAELIVTQGLSRVNEIWGCEINLIANGLYAGTADCIGLFDGKPSIIDFKNSKKIKKREWLEDYFCQGCAYLICHNEMYGTNIDQVVIMMASRTGEYENFVISGSEVEHYSLLWAKKVDDYYKVGF